jgi:hypothetical protein
MDETTRRGSPDRRTVLKGIGVGAAGVWVAPAVSSMFSAAAAVSAAACGYIPGAGVCEGQGTCDGDCACNLNADGVHTYCTQPTDCSNAACTTDADCPPGTVCQQTCCGATLCFVLCDGSNVTPKVAPTPGAKSSLPSKG